MPDTSRALGLRPATPAKPRLRLATRLNAQLIDQPPRVIDYLSRVPKWQMFANDRVGDCGPAALYHALIGANAYGARVKYDVADKEVLDLYSAVSGYDPNTGAHDDGVVMQDLLSTAVKRGTILAFAEVNVADQEEVLASLHLFGSLLVGVNLPADAQTQLDADRVWTATTGPNGRAGSWGGHAIHVGAHGLGYVCTTWGQTQSFTDEWWTAYVAEAWIAITPRWFDAQGDSPTGLDLHGLGEDYASLTGRTNPFPTAAPVTPSPIVPTPAPVVSPLAALATDTRLTKWRRSRHTGDNAYAADKLTAALEGEA